MEWIIILILVVFILVISLLYIYLIKKLESLALVVVSMYKTSKSEQELVRTLKRHIEKLQYEITELKANND